ncbi:MAG: hypothetical protein IKO65_03230, partial [Victivallales bacterium]|nr:hypothetical protein [Victivallales bacterium]
FTILFLLAWAVYASLCGQEVLQRGNALSTIPLTTSYDSGEYYDPCPIRLFSDDDYGLLALCQFLGTDRGMQISDPFRLLPEGKHGLFIGIATPGQEVSFRREEVEYFAGKGNVVILLTSSDGSHDFLASLDLCFATSQASKDAPRPLQALSEEWHAWNDEKTVFVRQTTNDGRIVVIGDSFAFCQKRFVAGNRELLNELLSSFPLELKAARVIQRKRYIRGDGKAIYGASSKRLPFPREHDPAFAPALTDSNDKETYLMTQQEFFSDERYYEEASTENSEFHNMMRVRTYDTFVAPDQQNPSAWHFAIWPSSERRLVPEPDFHAPGYKLMRVSTLFKPGVPEDKALLASISPDSRLIDICVRRVELKNPKESELERRVSERRSEVAQLEEEANPRVLLRLPWGQKSKTKQLEQARSALADEEAELQKVKVLNGRPDLERLEAVITNVGIAVLADDLDNFRVETTPSLSELEGCAFVYTIAYRTDYLRSDLREFKEDLFPDEMTISEWRRENQRAGVLPCPVPSHEAEALQRLANTRRPPWLVKSKNSPQSGEAYFPPIIVDALNGKDVAVKPLLQALTRDLNGYRDAIIQLKDEFNTFSEAMVYWRSGVCRHRARTSYMILNCLGIPARLVVSRSHAFVEVLVPKGDKGFWTQVNFGGGFGDDDMELFPQVTLPMSASVPGEAGGNGNVNGGLPAPSGAPSPGGLTFPPPTPPPPLWQILFAVFGALLALGAIAYGLIWYLRRHAKGNPETRIPMSSVTDFMLSQSEILDYDLQRGEYRGALLAVLETMLPRLSEMHRQRFSRIAENIKRKSSVSQEEYLRITDDLWKCEEESSMQSPETGGKM